MSFNIAVDGPAGAGKSTIARKVAKKLKFIYVDTGAMYRAMAVYMLRSHVDCTDEAALEEACRKISIELAYEDGEQQVILNGENVTPYIRTEEVSQMTSRLSARPAVRAALLNLQRRLAEEQDVLMDGRDIGTQVLPDAQLKVYLTASPAARAKRRYLEYLEKGDNTHSLEEIERTIAERDERDMNREIAPLKQADDAVLVDTSDMGIEEVTSHIISLYEEKKAAAE